MAYRARSYLDANCSHCHNPSTSGLFLTMDTPLDARLGFCKRPIAAGKGAGNRPVDILPGHADLSILTYRMETLEPGEMMPELGRSLSHSKGVDLVSEWIPMRIPARVEVTVPDPRNPHSHALHGNAYRNRHHAPMLPCSRINTLKAG